MQLALLRPHLGDPLRPGFEDCTGCNICVLPCPVWRQTHDRSLTLAGRAKALQRGIPVEALAASLEACVLCGACEPVCPVEIDTVGMTMDLRARLAEGGNSSLANAAAKLPVFAMNVVSESGSDSGSGSDGSQFLPGRALRANADRLRNIVSLFAKNKIMLAPDDGADLTIAIEAGLPIDPARKAKFLEPLAGARELIAGDGLLHRHLREWLPGVKVIGIGEALLRIAPVRSALKAGDLYVIETRGYHAAFARLVKFYDGLRQETGCAMNLDLLRAAIPTGAGSLQQLLGLENLDLAAQTRWVIEGRKIDRIVVEDAVDLAIFAMISPLPVVHLAELAG